MGTQGRDRFLYSLMDALARAIEAQDEYTSLHQTMVSRLARLLAQELQLSSFEIEGVRIAGQLHDIGKIAIPNELITKVGRLHDEEFTLIKTHVKRGVEILEKIEFPWPIVTMISQHHERMDGSGYPNGLRGEEILFGSRILAVADMANAVVSARPYREALGVEAVLSILRDEDKARYDADVISAFNCLLDKKDEQFIKCL